MHIRKSRGGIKTKKRTVEYLEVEIWERDNIEGKTILLRKCKGERVGGEPGK